MVSRDLPGVKNCVLMAGRRKTQSQVVLTVVDGKKAPIISLYHA